MKKIILGKSEYELVRNEKNAFDQEETQSLFTDYFEPFDYVFGDYAYDKLRLKGFNEKENKEFRKINDIQGLDDYIKNYCSYGAKYFLLKKLK